MVASLGLCLGHKARLPSASSLNFSGLRAVLMRAARGAPVLCPLRNLSSQRSEREQQAAYAALTQVQWKLTRGKWRPRLLGYAQDQKESDVRAASQAAFEQLGAASFELELRSESRSSLLKKFLPLPLRAPPLLVR